MNSDSFCLNQAALNGRSPQAGNGSVWVSVVVAAVLVVLELLGLLELLELLELVLELESKLVEPGKELVVSTAFVDGAVVGAKVDIGVLVPSGSCDSVPSSASAEAPPPPSEALLEGAVDVSSPNCARVCDGVLEPAGMSDCCCMHPVITPRLHQSRERRPR